MNTSKKDLGPDPTWDWSEEPRWLSSDSYAGNKEWSYRRWAWEFLNRNPESRTLFLGPPETREAAARRFGLVNLKNLRNVDKDNQKGYWLPEIVSECISYRESGKVSVGLNLKQGQVAIVFDLNQTVHAGRAAIDAMLSDARTKLFEELDLYGSELAARNVPTPKVFKPHRDSFLLWLRLCDALDADATDEQIIKVLYPSFCDNGECPTGERLKRVNRLLRDAKARAKEMMSQGYLSLVPLAHIQDKSTIGKAKAAARKAKKQLVQATS